jgi:ADP-ribose pyrophosphatase YjhB (NUDIX family)
VLVIRRALKEGRGKLALPGGYIDIGESWQEGIARELREETAVEVDPAGLKLMDLHSTPQGNHLLVFALAPPISLADLPPFIPTREVIERIVLQTFQELAFPLHSRMLEQYFSLFAPPQ